MTSLACSSTWMTGRLTYIRMASNLAITFCLKLPIKTSSWVRLNFIHLFKYINFSSPSFSLRSKFVDQWRWNLSQDPWNSQCRTLDRATITIWWWVVPNKPQITLISIDNYSNYRDRQLSMKWINCKELLIIMNMSLKSWKMRFMACRC